MAYVPLSRSYLHTPWPIAAFNVMSKPGREKRIAESGKRTRIDMAHE